MNDPKSMLLYFRLTRKKEAYLPWAGRRPRQVGVAVGRNVEGPQRQHQLNAETKNGLNLRVNICKMIILTKIEVNFAAEMNDAEL